jgi:choline dehydrogenase-like flavoprotein
MQCTFAPDSFKGGQIGEIEEMPGLSAVAWRTRTLSRGYVEAKSNRPGDMPAINPRYLSEESDRRAVIGGLRFARTGVLYMTGKHCHDGGAAALRSAARTRNDRQQGCW